MFRCTSAPMIEEFPKTLSDWGFTITDEGEFVAANGQHFDYFATDNERFNDIRHEVFQTLAREAIAEELRTKYDIHELFLSGKHGSKITTSRPDEAHVSILATEVSKLKRKRDVIVVIGETRQDAGIWAWRYVQRVGGMDKGSAVGLAAKLKKYGQEQKESALNGEMEGLAKRTKKLSIGGEQDDDLTPGLIILNPGQLLYSPQLKKNMSLTSWNQRARKTVISDPFDIDEKHNKIPGHLDPYTHIHTTFEHVLQQILSPDQPRLHILTVGDGSDPTLYALDQILLNKHELQVRGGTLQSIALVEPRHDLRENHSSKLPIWLAAAGKSWVQSEEEKGKLLDVPRQEAPAIEYSEGQRSTESGETKPTTDTSEDFQVNGTGEKDAAGEESSLEVARKDSVVPTGEETIPVENPDDIPPPAREPVSCPTFSAGIADGVVETVLPEVMDEVFAHFCAAIEAGRVKEAQEGVAWPRDYE